MTRSRTERFGASLVEALIVIAVVTLLAALASSLISARREGLAASEVSNLRQLAVAGSLYAEDTGWHPTRSCQVRRYVSDRTVFKSALDPTERGLGTIAFDRHNENSPVPSPGENPPGHSFIGLGDLGWSAEGAERELAGAENPGWLVSVTRSNDLDLLDPPQNLKGRIVRLNRDGAVVERTTGSVDSVFSFAWAYADFDEDTKRRHAREVLKEDR